jgi:hypothetical protein
MSELDDPIIKVHRVRSVDEATMLELLGADVIGVALAPEYGGSLFDDDRGITVKTAAAIGQALSRARLAVALPDEASRDASAVVDLASRCSAAYVQAPIFARPDSSVRHAIADARVGLIVSRVDASHDDDPGWLLSPVHELADPNIAFVEIELLPDQDDAWQFLCQESPKFPDELQLDDIVALGSDTPLLVSLNVTAENVTAIVHRLQNVRGLSMTLGRLSAGRYDVHALDLDRVAAVLRAVRGSKTRNSAPRTGA